jgi:hypothetical protein
MSSQIYSSRYGLLPGSSYDEVVAAARKEFNTIRKITKRQPYVRSKYFRGDKIFMTIFWDHLMQKHPKERRKRLKFYMAAIDLLRHTTQHPETSIETTQQQVFLHRFYGSTSEGVEFCVQVKVDKRSGRKDFMSVFQRKNK